MQSIDRPTRLPATHPILVDSHVHFYPCFELSLFFEGALENFRRGSQELRLHHTPLACLCFTESVGHNYFDQLSEQGTGRSDGRWRFEPTEESCSLYAIREGGGEILILAGRQVRTREGLEVLAVGSTERVPEWMTIPDTLARVTEIGAIPIIPWGFGKWWFRRGAIVKRLLESRRPGSFFLGDNSGRPRLSQRPKYFRVAEEKGFAILPGSDPLPFPRETTKAGRYGFLMDGQVSRRTPAEQLKLLARKMERTPPIFGGLEGLVAFCRNQAAIHINKQVRRWRP